VSGNIPAVSFVEGRSRFTESLRFAESALEKWLTKAKFPVSERPAGDRPAVKVRFFRADAK
jgi:hypothetical protein